jgi:serine phosphatase RsbU (regulator of sigma subunit)
LASASNGKGRRPSSPAARPGDGRGERQSRQSAGRRRVTHRLKLPIALKFAAFIAVLVVVSMAWQVRIATQEAGRQLEKAINDSGILLVSSIATLLDPSWIEDLMQRELEETLRKLSLGPGMERVQDVVVYNQRGEMIASARVTGLSLTSPLEIDYPEAVRAGVRITERQARGIPVRSFTKTLSGPRGGQRGAASRPDGDGPSWNGSTSPGAGGGASTAPVGTVDVFLSAQHIADSREALSAALTRISIISCIAASLGAFLLASFLTRPIRVLVKDLRQVSQGDLQHQSSVDSGDELGDLARTFNVMTSNLQAAQSVKLAQKAMEHELAVATRIQTRLLPSNTPVLPDLDLASFYLSAKEVGGDYYDFIPIDAEHLGIVVADVSGKGVPGSLVMTMTRSLLRMAAAGVVSPADTLCQVNACLGPDMSPGMFVTLLYMVVNTRSREVRLARAGHNAPFLYSRRHRKLIRLQPRGIAIGLDQRGDLFQSELEVQRFGLKPGDVLAAFTDGIVEGKSRHGEDFGEERLARLIGEHHERSAQEIVDCVMADLGAHQKGVERSDDITLLVLKAR